VVSAFNSQLEGKAITVPEHKEVTGAIGAALLAKEAANGNASKFRGFQEVINSDCDLSMFICKGCDNNCNITKMKIPGEKSTFYGSRCDRYDSTMAQNKVETAFDDREKLLFREYMEDAGSGLTVGIPRTLLIYDFAPLLIGFLNSLGTKVVLSDKTTKEIIEKSVELGHADSCFPVKLAHGHVSVLNGVDYILYPCAIRLGEKEGEENQKYACPLVQASPFIIKQVLGLEGKLLSPILDFSQGDTQVIRNLAGTAVQMGFSAAQGKKAAVDGLESQRRFETDKLDMGRKLLNQLKESNKLGVVLFARSYMSQDAGANMGIAEKLAQLGVITIPLDYLPLSTVSPSVYSDRPYWFYESKQIAGAAITATNPQLFGLVLTNFGCGPNSFILNILEDIMGGKPMGQLEIDEHAAEAGIVTRLEAFVDTINSYAKASGKYIIADKDIYRGTTAVINSHKTLLIPRMAPHADIVAAAMRACGADAMVLPEPNERNLLYSEQVTSGTECLPYRVTLGDFLRFYYDNGKNVSGYEGFAAGSYGPCRLGKYAIEQIRLLKDVGFDLPIRTTVSNNAYRDLNLGPDFERLAWKGIVAIDCLQKLVWRTRPYEIIKGKSDELFVDYLNKITLLVNQKNSLNDILKRATIDFKASIDTRIPRKPIVGINGEIYLRSNCFSNSDLVRVCEQAGLEVQVAPMGEWLKYTSYRNLEDSIVDGKIKRILASYIKKWVQEHDEHSVTGHFDGMIDRKEPSTAEILHETSKYLSPRCGSEAVLSIGCGLEWLKSPNFAGVISVMPHGCMPGGIVAAMADKFSAMYRKPWISLTYDGFLETNNLSRINAFAEVIKYCSTINV
jgi:predicted nucleotide-binding protein (sugar kinase/HSP70/actin superfamily)